MATEIDWRAVKHDVPPRNERRILAEVDVMPTSGQVACGQFLPPGKSAVLLYASELASLEALTQTADDKAEWSAAEKAFERRLAAHIAPIKDAESKKIAVATFGESPSSIYQANNPGKSLPPLRSSRVLVSDVPPPETPANLQSNQMSELVSALTNANAAQIQMIADAIAKLTGAQQSQQKR